MTRAGWWERRVVPRLVDAGGATESAGEARRLACRGLAGDVVEVGFGSGHNLPYLPGEVARLRAVDPSELGTRLARRRLEASPVPVEFSGLDGQALPFPDADADAVLMTFTLCTIPDPAAALREIRRVLRPGGRLHFVEHGRAPDTGVLRWQRRLEPLQRRLVGGCHLTRDASKMLTAAGFSVEVLDQRYLAGEPKPWAYVTTGHATP